MDIAANLASLRERIAAASARAGRDPASVTLMAVSKNQPPDAVRASLDAGLNCFGENRVQEAKAKIPLCPNRAQWQMIGHLQSNKCRDAVALFSMIQSVDSLALALALNQQCEKAARAPNSATGPLRCSPSSANSANCRASKFTA